MITEEVFYNKELCDAVRRLVKNSTYDYDRALLVISQSKDYNRDLFIIEKLANNGTSKSQIFGIIQQINT